MVTVRELIIIHFLHYTLIFKFNWKGEPLHRPLSYEYTSYYWLLYLRAEQVFTDGIAQPHPLLTAGAPPQLINDDQRVLTNILLAYNVH